MNRWNDSLYFGIHCELDKSKPPIIASKHNHDPAIWQGEHLELLIETDKHSYYQIVVNPAGAMIDLDRAVTLKKAYDWSSQAEVASHVGEGYWSAEIRLPITSSEDPLHKISGNRPFVAKQRALDSGKVGLVLQSLSQTQRDRRGRNFGLLPPRPRGQVLPRTIAVFENLRPLN